MIGLSTATYDLDGSIVFMELPSSQQDRTTRRINVVKTLDGGVSVEDRGHGIADNLIELVTVATEPLAQLLKALVINYSEINVSTKNGFYVCAAKKLELKGGTINLTFQIIR